MKNELDFTNLDSDNREELFVFIKKLVKVSEQEPATVYPYFEKIAELLGDDKDAIRWTAMKIIGNLAVVDKDNLIDNYLQFFLDALNKGNMITANNAINALTKIAIAKKQHLDTVVTAFLDIDKFKYELPEYSNVIAGKAITALISLFPFSVQKEEIKKLAELHIKRGRPESLARAEQLLKELDENKKKEDD
jgi:hypothetical protein